MTPGPVTGVPLARLPLMMVPGTRNSCFVISLNIWWFFKVLQYLWHAPLKKNQKWKKHWKKEKKNPDKSCTQPITLLAVPKHGYPDPSLVATILTIEAGAGSPTYIHLFKTKEKLPVFFQDFFVQGGKTVLTQGAPTAAKVLVGVLLTSSFLATVDIDKRWESGETIRKVRFVHLGKVIENTKNSLERPSWASCNSPVL